MIKTKWRGIRPRLFLAFAVLTAFTLFASVVGWLSHDRLGSELSRVVEGNIYTLQLVADIKARATTITLIAPTLLVAKDQLSQHEIWQRLNRDIAAMVELFPKVAALSPNNFSNNPLLVQLEALERSMANLNDNVRQKLLVLSDKELLNQRLRWAAAVFLSDIEILNHQLENTQYQRFSEHLSTATTPTNKEIQGFYRLQADVNLLINLIERAQHLPDFSSLVAIHIHSNQVIEQIYTTLATLHNFRTLDKLINTLASIVVLAQERGNIFSIRREQRAIEDEGYELLRGIHRELGHLNAALGSLAKEAERASQNSVLTARQTIERGRIWMVSLVVASLLFSVLILWLYVGRNMVARITSLDASMRAIANGNLEREVQVKGSDEIGAMARSLLSFRDQLSVLQEELVQAGKLAALGQLSAGIAHEINQPLAAISHYARNGIKLIALDRTEQARQNLQQISNLTKRAISIITRLKSMAREQRADLLPIELSTVIEAAVQLLAEDEARAQTTIKVIVQERQNLVLGDQIQLEQVLLNLLINALDAIADSPLKEIEINCRHSVDYIEMRVVDSGPGISEKALEQIFDPFFSTKRRGQNLGLGLSISFNIIKSFQGKLSVENTESRGASFCIQLPKYQRGKK